MRGHDNPGHGRRIGAALANANPPLRLGIAGLGLAGTIMLRGLQGWDGAEVTAAADHHETLLANFAGDYDAETHKDVAGLCQSNRVEAIYVATQHQFHAEHAIMAAEHGKHIILEKPMALSLADCDAIIDAVERAGVQMVIGPTHSFDPNIEYMAEIIESGQLGALSMINTWNFNDFLYRPRRPEELDTSQGGGIIFNQLPHQIDSIRLLCGDKLHSVYAALGVLDPARPTEGNATVMLRFEGGAAASMVYSGYDRFDSDEFFGWVGEGGQDKPGDTHGQTRARLKGVSQVDEKARRTSAFGYKPAAEISGGRFAAPDNLREGHFGVMVVSCEGGDMRPTPDGIAIYDDNGARIVKIPADRFLPSRPAVVQELANAIAGTPPVRNGQWGRVSLEAALAIQQSSAERREILL